MLELVIQLILGLGIILIGANFLISGSSAIARRFGISEFVVGLTIVGIGTSTPEMVVSFISAIQGNSDIAVGNIVGSNLANTLLILGLVAVVSPIPLTNNNQTKDIPFFVVATAILFIIGSDILIRGAENNIITRLDGGILLVGFLLFMIYSFRSSKKTIVVEDNIKVPKSQKLGVSIIFIVLGLAGLIFGGNLFVESSSALASSFGVSDAFIGITVMAIGTSLPELATSMVAALKRSSQMALGNIIGSNIANIFLILGGSALINPLTMTDITMVDMGLVLVSSILVFITAFTFKKRYIDRWEGVIFLFIYIAYIYWLVSQIG